MHAVLESEGCTRVHAVPWRQFCWPLFHAPVGLLTSESVDCLSSSFPGVFTSESEVHIFVQRTYR